MKRQTQHTSMKLVAAISLMALLLAALIVPLAAQENTVEAEDGTVMIVGPISFSATGDIIVETTDETTGATTSYIIAPAGAFLPSQIQAGDIVIIIGDLLPDGATVQAITFELFIEEEPEATPEMTPEVTEEPEVTPEATPEMTPEVTPEVTPEMTPEPEVTEEPVYETCGNANHPVAARLAEEFGLSTEEVVAMHCAGNGYGNIARALLLAEASEAEDTAQDFLDRHQQGEGWGHIVRESGVHPSQLAPGRIGKGADDTTAVDDTAGTTENADASVAPAANTQPGNGNGNGRPDNPGNGNGRPDNPGQGNGNNGNNGNGGNKGGKNK